MIATLRGQVTEHLPDGLVLECGGVGYGVKTTAADTGASPPGVDAKFYIHEHIKEDQFDLYGFLNADSKALFEQLLGVKNVGPKVALALLDTGSTGAVRTAIAGGDIKQLQTAKGVGRRAAEQIVVELRDKMGAAVGAAAEQLVGRGGINTADEAVQALIALGYSEADAALALQNIDPSLPTEARIKQALKS